MRWRHRARFCAAALLTPFGLVATVGASAVPAFPGARGHGATAVGGRGGTVFVVRNLCDYDGSDLTVYQSNQTPLACGDIEQTLRWAVEDPDDVGARTVVFAVSGTIELRRALSITKDYLTIAGQTATGLDGSQMQHYGITLGKPETGSGDPNIASNKSVVQIYASDVVIRHVRIRNRDCEAPSGENCDLHRGVSIESGAARVILDHVSVSWGTDDLVGIGGASDVTVQRSIVSESYTVAGKGILFTDTDGISIHHNLFVYNGERTPAADAKYPSEFVSNCVHGFNNSAATVGLNTTEVRLDCRSNYYHQGYWEDGGESSGHQTGQENAFDLERDLSTATPKLVLWYRNTVGFSATDPGAIHIFSTGNKFWNSDRQGLPANEGVDPFSDEPLCHDDSTGELGLADQDANGSPTGPHCVGVFEIPTETHTVAESATPIAHTRADDLDALLDDVGALPWSRDATDARVVSYVIYDSEATDGAFIGSAPPDDYGSSPYPPPADTPLGNDTDWDGMDDGWESTHGISDPNADADGDGYTNVEEYLNRTPPIDSLDDDEDNVANDEDNCLDLPNGPDTLTYLGQQCDADMDGYGNPCDADFNQDWTVGGPDAGIFGMDFGTAGYYPGERQTDLDCNGAVGGPDYGMFGMMIGNPVGPSGLSCAGTVPCP